MPGRLKKVHLFAASFLVVPFLILLCRAPGLRFYFSNPDHGYQLALGKQILLGRFPFVDLFFHYGPLTAFTSAFGLWISHSLILETIICSLGYATSIFLIHYLTNHYVSRVAGFIAPLLGLLLLSRFYKWYYWLFPLLILYCVHRFLISTGPQQRSRWLFTAGFIGSLGGLFRLDLGIAFFCFYLIFLLVLDLKPRNLKLFTQQVAVFVIGSSVPLLLWGVVLGFYGGAFADYLDASLAGARGAVEIWSLPVPAFDRSKPLSPQSTAALAFLALLLTNLSCLLVGSWRRFRSSDQENVKYAFMMAAGLLGLGIAPQAFHRADIPHLLQALPPVLIQGSLLTSELWQARQISESDGQRRFFLPQGLGVCYLALVAVSIWGIRGYGGSELSQWEVNPIPRYRELSQGIQSGINHPLVRLVTQLQLQTDQNESILVVPDAIALQVHLFSDRPMSGFLPAFFPGILDNDRWRLRNFRAIQQDPPKVVFLHRHHLSPDSVMGRRQPELVEFLRNSYRRVISEDSGWLLITR